MWTRARCVRGDGNRKVHHPPSRGPPPAFRFGIAIKNDVTVPEVRDPKAPFICSIYWLGCQQCSVRREEPVLWQAPRVNPNP